MRFEKKLFQYSNIGVWTKKNS